MKSLKNNFFSKLYLFILLGTPLLLYLIRNDYFIRIIRINIEIYALFLFLSGFGAQFDNFLEPEWIKNRLFQLALAGLFFIVVLNLHYLIFIFFAVIASITSIIHHLLRIIEKETLHYQCFFNRYWFTILIFSLLHVLFASNFQFSNTPPLHLNLSLFFLLVNYIFFAEEGFAANGLLPFLVLPMELWQNPSAIPGFLWFFFSFLFVCNDWKLQPLDKLPEKLNKLSRPEFCLTLCIIPILFFRMSHLLLFLPLLFLPVPGNFIWLLLCFLLTHRIDIPPIFPLLATTNCISLFFPALESEFKITDLLFLLTLFLIPAGRFYSLIAVFSTVKIRPNNTYNNFIFIFIFINFVLSRNFPELLMHTFQTLL
ncbi:hypothetical protein ACFL35_15375 [Candidatus Riflebacteria bacterium]